MPNNIEPKDVLMRFFSHALATVNGRNAVSKQLLVTPIKGDVAIAAIGKAASDMMLGAQKVLGEQIQSALVITKKDHADKNMTWPCIESGHPIPDEQSLVAGTKLLEFIANIPSNTQFLALISGGASALVEILPDNMDLEELQKVNKDLLAQGLTIHEMNRTRQSISMIKGGKCLQYLRPNKMIQHVISDVENDDLSIIGSGLFVSKDNNAASNIIVESHVVANNEMACHAISELAKSDGYTVKYHGQTLYGDVFELAESLVAILNNAEEGIHIWGGEPTIVLPENPGRGGRNQSLALALACQIECQKGITILVGATDGSDGATEDTGAIVDGTTLQQSVGNAQKYLAAADAGSFLAETGALISTGPTGTNVMDIVIVFKAPISAVS